MKNRTETTRAAATILICLGLLACAGCGSDDGPTTPEEAYATFSLEMSTTAPEDLNSSYWHEADATIGASNYYANGNWNYEPVMVELRFTPIHPMFSSELALSSVWSSCPAGCDLVTVNGIPIGATFSQVESMMGAPATSQDNGDGNIQATFEDDLLRIDYSSGDGAVWMTIQEVD